MHAVDIAQGRTGFVCRPGSSLRRGEHRTRGMMMYHLKWGIRAARQLSRRVHRQWPDGICKQTEETPRSRQVIVQ